MIRRLLSRLRPKPKKFTPAEARGMVVALSEFLFTKHGLEGFFFASLSGPNAKTETVASISGMFASDFTVLLEMLLGSEATKTATLTAIIKALRESGAVRIAIPVDGGCGCPVCSVRRESRSEVTKH